MAEGENENCCQEVIDALNNGSSALTPFFTTVGTLIGAAVGSFAPGPGTLIGGSAQQPEFNFRSESQLADLYRNVIGNEELRPAIDRDASGNPIII